MYQVLLWALRKVAESYEELMAFWSGGRSSRVCYRPSLEGLEERWCPADVSMYWDPTSGNNASTLANWDTGSLGSGMHPTAAPGNTNGESDITYFDGTAGKGGNKNCTWDYTPTNALSSVSFQDGWTQTVTFLDQKGFSVSADSGVFLDSAPTLAPNGDSGANAVAAITLKNGAKFSVFPSSTLYLSGYSSGNAIFLAGDGTAGEYLNNGGAVTYTGESGTVGTPYIDYLNIPVKNTGVFKVNGNGDGSTTSGSTLQVSGSDTNNTNGVSYYQNNTSAETDISGNGTLWCVNDFSMNGGLLQTKDAYTDNLQVGTGGSSPVDGTVTLSGGTVNINPGNNVYGVLQIWGTTDSNAPTLNVGAATLNFKVSMTSKINAPAVGTSTYTSDQLIVGNSTLQGNMKGKVNLGYNSTQTTIGILPQGTVTNNHKWNILFYGTVTGTDANHVTVTTGYTPKWTNPNWLEIDN